MRRFLPILALPAALLAGCTAAGPGSATTGPGAAVTTPAPATTNEATTSPATTSAGTTVKAATPRCHTGDLRVTSAYGDGAAGTFSVYLRFTNHSAHPCTLYGYPGVSWVRGGDGKQVNDAFTRTGGAGRTVTIRPGGTAHSELLIVRAGNFDPKICKPVAVRGFRVYPPDETAAIFVASPQQACSVTGVGLGRVQPIIPGPGTSAG